MFRQTLNLLPCAQMDLGKQRCRVGPKLLDQLHITIGSFVKVHHEDNAYICSIWPRGDACDGYFQFDSVVMTALPTKPASDSTHVQPAMVYLLSKSCKQVEIIAIVVDIENAILLRKQLSCASEKMQKYFKQCLLNYCVQPNTLVCLDNNRFARMCKISSVFIKSTSNTHDVGSIIKEKTKIIIKDIVSKERYSYANIASNELVLGGLDNSIQEILDIITIPLMFSSMTVSSLQKGILLRGPPGCGKTSLVRYIARKCNALLIPVNGPDVFQSLPGASEDYLKTVFTRARLSALEGLCIIFLDEIDTLCPVKEKSSSNQSVRITSQLLSLMDSIQNERNIIVMAATNQPGSVDPSLRRAGRFDKEFAINVPTSEQRKQILLTLTSTLPCSDDFSCDLLVPLTGGYVGADLVALCQEATYTAFSEISKTSSGNHNLLVPVSLRHFQHALTKVTPSTLRGCDAVVELTPVQWHDIGGLDHVKIAIKQAIEWPIKHPEAFARFSLPCSKGVLLYGPPGCCKTTLVRAAASSCHATLLAVNGAQLFSPYVGDSERALVDVFHKARMSTPSIVFLDEIDAIVGKRSESTSNRGVQERLLSTLLNEMDGIGTRLDDKMDSSSTDLLQESMMKEGEIEDNDDISNRKDSTTGIKVENAGVLVVGATNRPDLVDEALLRPGRFDRLIYVPQPDKQGRLEILKVVTREMPLVDINLDELSNQTKMFSGADLKGLCTEAALLALTQDGLEASNIKQCHIDEALESFHPSLTVEMISQYEGNMLL